MIILVGSFIGNSFSTYWYEHQDPWLTTDYLPSTRDFEVQIPASSREYVLWVVVLDNVSSESQTVIMNSYIVGSLEVFFNNKLEVFHNESALAEDIGDEFTYYAPASFGLVYRFKNPDELLNLGITVPYASASAEPIWWVKIFRDDYLFGRLFIDGFVLGAFIVGFIGVIIYFLVFFRRGGKKEHEKRQDDLLLECNTQ